MKISDVGVYVIPLIEPFFAKANTFNETSRNKFAASVGVDPTSLKRVCPTEKWLKLQAGWKRERDRKLLVIIRQEMKEMLRTAQCRSEFSVTKILSQIKVNHPNLEISAQQFYRLASDEWHESAATLPSIVDAARAKILKRLQEHVDANTPVSELTLKRLFTESNNFAKYGSWLGEPYRAARAELTRRQHNEAPMMPIGRSICIIPGGWVDLDSDEWEFKQEGKLLHRSALRIDIGEVIWPLLQENVRKGENSLSTIYNRYTTYKQVGRLLNSEVPDVRHATLERVQRAWSVGVSKTGSNVPALRSALIHLFARVYMLAEVNSDINKHEMFKIVVWLSAKIKLPSKRPHMDFLTGGELDELLTCCVRDIESGFKFLSENQRLFTGGAYFRVQHDALPVIHLSAALVILTMAFTGLRPRSVKDLEIKDSMCIHPQLSAVAWRHPKKKEESIALTPVTVAILLEQFVNLTSGVRQRLETNHIFLTGDPHGNWNILRRSSKINYLLDDFVRKHDLSRDGLPLPLTPTMLRRTYATQQLYSGRSIWFVRAQFNHTSIKTTQKYLQLDRFEHPAHVRGALDGWGKQVLGLWKNPALLEDVDSCERALIFSELSSDISSESCQDDPSVCACCEHLITGDEFLEKWEEERLGRERALQTLEADPESAHLVKAARVNHQRFLNNYSRVKKGVN